MINLAVINLKNIIKNFSKTIIFIIISFLMINSFKKIDLKKINIFSNISIIDITAIKKNISIASYFEEEKKIKNSNVSKILKSELVLFSSAEEALMEKENMEELKEFDIENNKNAEIIEQVPKVEENKKEENNEKIQNIEDTVNLENIKSDVETKVITENNKIDKFTDVYKTVKIKNESKYKLTEKMVTPDYVIKNKKDIIIFHTHTCESYTKTEKDNYVESGNFRTIDLSFNVAKVGEELAKILTNTGYNVIHNISYHDYPAYTGSYSRSLKTVKGILENKKDVEIVIDLHRDALGSNSNYAPSVVIGEEKVAQLMFVIGTDGGGLEHSNWNNNLKVAIKIQEKANEMYPGLFKPIILRNSRYNQNVSNGACIIEVGATGNTIEECKNSMKYLSKVIDEVLKE